MTDLPDTDSNVGSGSSANSTSSINSVLSNTTNISTGTTTTTATTATTTTSSNPNETKDDNSFFAFDNASSGTNSSPSQIANPRSFLQEPRRESMFASDFLSAIAGNSAGGLSAASSRRPSYAAEFSSRPRFLDLADAFNGSTGNVQSSHEMPRLSAAVSNPNLSPFNSDMDRWLRVGVDNVTGGTVPGGTAPGGTAPGGHFSTHAPTISSNLRRTSTTPTTNVNANTTSTTISAPLWKDQDLSPTREEFNLPPIPPSQKKTFRSLSFSNDQHQLHQQQPGSHQLLGSFNEEEDFESSSNLITLDQEDLSLVYGAIGQESNSNYQNPPSLWFNSGLGTNGAGSRRHSYAGEHYTTEQQKQQDQQLQNPQQTHQPRQPSNLIETRNSTSPVTSTEEQIQQLQIQQTPNSQPKLTYTEAIENYFSTDKLGRNTLSESILGQQQSSPHSLSPTSSISPDDGSPTISNATPANLSSLISVPSKKLYFVQFKAGRIDVFFIPDSSGLVVHVNDLVIVDADRGRDLGKVVKDQVTTEEAGMLKYIKHQEQQAILQHNPNTMPGNSGSSSTPGTTMPKQILRFAQSNEVQQITSKQSDEEKSVAMCVHKVQEKGLDMSVIDAEYQWDRRKLTFFYSATHRIDFRDLVRELFRIYKTRIWMCAVNPAAAAAAAAAAASGENDGSNPTQASPIMDTTSVGHGATTGTNPGSSSGSPPVISQNHPHPVVQQQSEYGLATSQLFGAGPGRGPGGSSQIRQQPLAPLPSVLGNGAPNTGPGLYGQAQPSFNQWSNGQQQSQRKGFIPSQVPGSIPYGMPPQAMIQPVLNSTGQYSQPSARTKYTQYNNNIPPMNMPPNGVGMPGQYWYGPPPPPPPPTNTFY